MARDAIAVTKTPGFWSNKHQNINQPIELLYDVWNPPPPVTNLVRDLNLTIAKIHSLIEQAQKDKKRLRAVGGGWSLSSAAAADGRLINTKPLNWYFPLSAKSVSEKYDGDRTNLLYVQCGVSINELNSHLAARGKSLSTSGASNGQTIVGAMSTGTHGSAFDVGSIQDCVVGLHIITNAKKSIWLERKSYPVVSDDFLSKFECKIIRDDAVFNSAIVSFGSFGFIHAVMIEAEPIYLLEAFRQKLPMNNNLKKNMDTLDFSLLPLPSPANKPYHFEVVLNPHNINDGAYVTTIYKRPYSTNYTPPGGISGGLGPGDDLLCFVGSLTDGVPGIIGTLVNQLASSLYTDTFHEWGTLGEIFSATNAFGKASSTEIGIDHKQTSKAFDIIMDAHNAAGPFAGFISFRYVKKSKATLAFTKFPVTCTIEFPGAYSARSRKFYEEVWTKLEAAGIPYTLHWGQENNFTPARVKKMYGTAVDEWIESRKKILDENGRNVFNNDFLVSCGLT